jgi:hypothetical protein
MLDDVHFNTASDGIALKSNVSGMHPTPIIDQYTRFGLTDLI